MQRSKLISYIKHPELLKDLSFEELQSWVAEFPYSQNLRTLLAKKVKDEGLEKKYEHLIHDAALYSSDRPKLYDTINAVQKEEVEEVAQEEPESNAPTFIDRIMTASGVIVTTAEPEELDAVDHVQQDRPDASAEKISEDNYIMEEKSHSEQNHRILRGQSDVEEPEIRADSINESETDQPETDNHQQVGLSSFSQWLLELEQQSEEESEYDSDEGVISESLAKILESQGHINKAVKMYKKLSLKYPEKSGYFAAQIEQITS